VTIEYTAFGITLRTDDADHDKKLSNAIRGERMTEAALDKKRIITELTKSAHGKLDEYLTIGRQAAIEDPDFFAHLVAWNHQHGQIRDAKIALPVIALAMLDVNRLLASKAAPAHLADGGRDVYVENALAHIADLRPRELARVLLTTTRMEKTETVAPPRTVFGRVRAVKVPKDKDKKDAKPIEVPPFIKTANAPKRVMRRLVTRYLRDLEAERRQFEYVAVQHHRTLHELYARYHVSRPAWVGEVLFHGEKGKLHPDAPKVLPGGIFAVIRGLHIMDVVLAAGSIVKYKIPFLVARGALGKKANDPDTVLALMKAMSSSELVTNMKWLEKLGVKTNPALRAALEEALGKAATSKKVTLKTTRAAEALADDEALSSKLRVVQEKQIENLGGIDGDWLVAGDKSGSMHDSIDASRNIAAFLARSVKGKVHLIFFDTVPRHFDVTGKSLEEITALTRGIAAGGGTNMHCPLQYAMDSHLSVDGIVYVSDGANHGPQVIPYYRKYCEKMSVDPTMYFYQLAGEADVFSNECRAAGVDLQTFDLRNQTVDFYSLPNLAKTMRVSRYSLLDEVLATPLRTLDEVLDKTKGMSILPKQVVHV
jgi:hypothetical protein